MKKFWVYRVPHNGNLQTIIRTNFKTHLKKVYNESQINGILYYTPIKSDLIIITTIELDPRLQIYSHTTFRPTYIYYLESFEIKTTRKIKPRERKYLFLCDLFVNSDPILSYYEEELIKILKNYE